MDKGMITKLKRSHEDATIELFRRDPALAAEYLEAILRDGNEGELLHALLRLAKAYGSADEFAGRAQDHAKTLFRSLSAQGNPEMKSLLAILKSMGLRLTVTPLDDKHPPG
jgi:probable addiction module antidote protein